MSSQALRIFERLVEQVGVLDATAREAEVRGNRAASEACLRSGIVLLVAAVDAYFHERGVEMLVARALVSQDAAKAVADFAGLTVDDVTGPAAPGLLRLNLSYKTLQSPEKVDKLLEACGVNGAKVWLHATASSGSRPDRARLQLKLQIDRRNQIAHEGDWDPSAVDFRAIAFTHLEDCVGAIVPLIRSIDRHLT